MKSSSTSKSLSLALLPAQLAFEPEHAEIVTNDGIDIEALLIVDPDGVFLSEVSRSDDQWRRYDRLRGVEQDRRVSILILREQDAAFDAEIGRSVAGLRRGRYRDRGNCPK